MHYIPINQTHLVIFGVGNPADFDVLPCCLCNHLSVKYCVQNITVKSWLVRGVNDMKYAHLKGKKRRSQWRRGLRRRSAATHLLRSWVRIPPGAWIFVCCECRVLSGRGLCDELLTRPEQSYRLCCVVVCDLETSRIGAPYIYDISNLGVNLSRNTLQYMESAGPLPCSQKYITCPYNEPDESDPQSTCPIFKINLYHKCTIYVNNICFL